MILWVLDGEKLKHVVADHLRSSFRACSMNSTVVCMFVPLQRMLQSSEKMVYFIGGGILSNMLFIATRERVTLMTEPWGTPFSVVWVVDNVSSILVWNDLSCKKLVMNLVIFPVMFHSRRIRSTLCLQTISYAFVKSSATRIVYCFILAALHLCDWILDKALKVEWFFRNLYCSLLNFSETSRYHMSLELIIFSSTLHSVLIREMDGSFLCRICSYLVWVLVW